MSLTGQIVREKIAAPTLNGFFLTMRWRYDSGLGVLDKIIEPLDILLQEEINVLGDILQFFPKSIPGGTEFITFTGGTYVTERDAVIKDYDQLGNPGIDDSPDERVLVWSSTARYSYFEANDPLDEDAPPSFTPWQYPGSDTEYVPVGQWPLPNYDYARWQGVAQHYLTFTAEAPWGLMLRPDTSDAYNLISFNDWGGCQVVDWTSYIGFEGREPLVTFTNVLTAFGISWRQTTQGGARQIEVWLRPQPPDQVDDGFYFPSFSTGNNVSLPALLLSSLVTGQYFFSAFAEWFKRFAVLSARHRPMLLSSDGRGISTDGKGLGSSQF